MFASKLLNLFKILSSFLQSFFQPLKLPRRVCHVLCDLIGTIVKDRIETNNPQTRLSKLWIETTCKNRTRNKSRLHLMSCHTLSFWMTCFMHGFVQILQNQLHMLTARIVSQIKQRFAWEKSATFTFSKQLIKKTWLIHHQTFTYACTVLHFTLTSWIATHAASKGIHQHMPKVSGFLTSSFLHVGTLQSSEFWAGIYPVATHLEIRLH